MEQKNDIIHPLIKGLLVVMVILFAFTIRINNRLITVLVEKRDSLIEVIDSAIQLEKNENDASYKSGIYDMTDGEESGDSKGNRQD